MYLSRNVQHELTSNSAFDFSSRTNAGDISEQLNGHIALSDAPEEPPSEARIKLKANTDMSKFSYKTMAMKLSEASEVLDDRIDEFRQLLQEHLDLEDSAFGNPSYQSPNEVIAVGRICSDTNEGKLNAASIVLGDGVLDAGFLWPWTNWHRITSSQGKLSHFEESTPRARTSSSQKCSPSLSLHSPPLLPQN
jgi:hypothetical protein